MTAEGNNEMFQSYSDCIMEAADFCSQNSVSDIIAAHLKMLLLLLLLLLFAKCYPEHEDSRGQNVWIVNPFVEHKETAPLVEHKETAPFVEHKETAPFVEHKETAPFVEHKETAPFVEHKETVPFVEHK